MPESPRKSKRLPMMYEEEDSSTDEEDIQTESDDEEDVQQPEYVDADQEPEAKGPRTFKEAVYTTTGPVWRDILRTKALSPVDISHVPKGLNSRRR